MAYKTALRGNNFKILISQRMLELLNGSIELFMSKRHGEYFTIRDLFQPFTKSFLYSVWIDRVPVIQKSWIHMRLLPES